MSVSKNIVQKTNSWEPASSLGYLPDLHWHLSLWPCLKGAISQWQLYWPRRQDGLSLCRTVWCTWEHNPSVVVIQHLQTFPVEKHCPSGLAGWVCLGWPWMRVDGPDSWAWCGEGQAAVQVWWPPLSRPSTLGLPPPVAELLGFTEGLAEQSTMLVLITPFCSNVPWPLRSKWAGRHIWLVLQRGIKSDPKPTDAQTKGREPSAQNGPTSVVTWPSASFLGSILLFMPQSPHCSVWISLQQL